MYLKFFNLRKKPFELAVDPRFLFYSANHREALANLVYGIREGKGFIVLTGEVGTGKTTLLHALLDLLHRSEVQTAFLFNSTLSRSDLYRYLLADFGLTPGNRSKSGVLITLYHWLLERHRAGKQTVLIIDEAHNLTRALLEEIRLLSNLETARGKLLQIVLAGQPELDHRLKDPVLRQLRQRISLYFSLPPLTRREVELYVARRLQVAGLPEQTIFDADALREVHSYSQGLPRLINTICDNALVLAFSRGQDRVNREIIQAVARQFELSSLEEDERWVEMESERLGAGVAEPALPTEWESLAGEIQRDPFAFFERQFSTMAR